MPLRNEKVEPPSDDKRWRIVQATMQRNGFERDGLIETLHLSLIHISEPTRPY